MAVVRTAISLDEDLFEKLDLLAKELDSSRSRLLAMALEKYMEEIENRKLLVALNEAYGDDEMAEELALLGRHMETRSAGTTESW